MKKNLGYLFSFLCLSISLQAFTITSYSPSLYSGDINAFRTAVGITAAYTIEDFQDTSFATGLSVTYQYNNLGYHDIWSNADLGWGDSSSLVTCGGNYSGYNGGVIFSFTPGVQTFGIGIGQMSSDSWYVRVNGSTTLVSDMVASLPNFVAGGSRNVYLKITAGQGETISSVLIQRGAQGDRIHFDYLAFQTATSVPEASSLALLGMAFLGLAGRRIWIAHKRIFA